MSQSKNFEIDQQIIAKLTIKELSKFIEPLGYLAKQSEESGNKELCGKIEDCIDFIYDQINLKIMRSEENGQP